MLSECPECKGQVSSEAASCPHCGFVQKKSPQPLPADPPTDQPELAPNSPTPEQAKPSSTTSGGFLDPKKNLRSIIVLGALFGVLFIGIWIYRSVGKATGTLPFQQILQRSDTVKDDTWTIYQARFTEDVEVRLSLNVTRGNGVTWYVMDESVQQSFADAQKSLFGGNFVYYKDLSGKDQKSFNASGGLKAGDYVIAVKQRSDPNILGAADEADVTVTLLARPRTIR